MGGGFAAWVAYWLAAGGCPADEEAADPAGGPAYTSSNARLVMASGEGGETSAARMAAAPAPLSRMASGGWSAAPCRALSGTAEHRKARHRLRGPPAC